MHARHVPIPIAAAATANPAPVRPRLVDRLGVTALVFLLVLATRLYLIHRFATDLPYSDQWDSEIWDGLRPFANGAIDWPTLFAAHNEHRIALVRLVALPQFALNEHQWDNLVQVTCNALFVAVACAFALRALQRQLGGRFALAGVLVVAACCLPCGYENLLIGFQSQFYFLIALAACGIWLGATRRPGIGVTIVLAAIAVASLFSIASGVVTPGAIGLAVLLRLRVQPSDWLRAVPLLLLLALATWLGCHLLVSVSGHDAIRAQGVSEWFVALRALGSWPLPASWLSFAALWLPLLIVAARVLSGRERDPVATAMLALGAWTGVQIASIAYGRGHDLGTIASRYTDILAVGLVVNGYAAQRALATHAAAARPRTAAALVAAWFVIVVGAWSVQGVIAFRTMQWFADSRDAQSANVRAYLHGNRAALERAEPWNLPYPDRRILKRMLDDATVQAMLPVGARLPLSLGAFHGDFEKPERPGGDTLRGLAALGPRYDAQGLVIASSQRVDHLHTRFGHVVVPLYGYADGAPASVRLDDGAAPAQGSARAIGKRAGWSAPILAVPVPDFSFSVAGSDAAAGFAAGPPVEIGRLSVAAVRLLDASPWLLGLAAGGWLAWVVARLRRLRSNRSRQHVHRSTGAR
jgi:hypothetical protein